MKKLNLFLCTLMLGLLASTTVFSQIKFPGGRIAISSDGNQHDEDDWGANAMALAFIDAANLNSSFVHLDHSNHLGDNDSSYEKEMITSSVEGAKRFNLDVSRVFNNQKQLSAAINNFKNEGNKSSASNPLWFICAGPMEVAYRMIKAVDPDKRQYIHCISHSSWNDRHQDTNQMSHDWNDIDKDFPTVMHKIKDQNGSNGNDDFNTPKSKWDWLKNSPNADYRWVYSRNKKGSFDVSDSGMTYWLITGGPNGGCQDCGWKETKALFENTTPTPPSTVAVTGVSLSGGSGILQIGEKTTFSANVLPNNASNKSVTWSSNNNNVASVDANGVVTAKANGSATITVKTVDGNKTASANITVKETTIPTPPTPPTGGCNLPKVLNDVVINKQTVNTSFGTAISCAASVTISMTIEGIGPMENADYLNIYYKVDGGSPITISENRDAFSSKTISATGIKGNLVEIIVDGFTSFRDETYTVSNILISADDGTTTPTPDTGGQNDTSITFTKPSNNQTFNTGDDVVVNVTTLDNSNVTKVELYLDGAFVRQELYASYDWGHTSSLDPVLKNMKAGTYSLKAVVTDKAGKVTENAIKIVVGVGKKNSNITEDAFLMIAPNPVTGATLNITQKGAENLQIVNMLGVVVKKIAVDGEQIAVDISQLSTGIYVLKANDSNLTNMNAKFVVE